MAALRSRRLANLALLHLRSGDEYIAEQTDNNVPFVPLPAYIDSHLIEIRRAVDLALGSTGDVSLREHIEAIFEEHRRSLVTAEQEREKAAQALAISLEKLIANGDQALHDHVGQQVQQIREAMLSAEKLEMQRMSETLSRLDAGDVRLREHIEAQIVQIAGALESARRETRFAHEASDKAIHKAEVAADKRFDGQNEFREQLTQQALDFLRKETFDTVVASWTVWRNQTDANIVEIQKKLGELTAVSAAISASNERREDKHQPWQIWAVGAFVSLLIALIVVGVGAFT